MVLSPLAVILLAQLALVMLGIIVFQKIQKIRFIKEIKKLKSSRRSSSQHEDDASDTEYFDRQQAELLLNRLLQNIHTITSEAPAAKALCENQQALVYTLGDCLNIPLDSTKKRAAPEPSPIPILAAAATAASTLDSMSELDESMDLISQDEIDDALGKEEELDAFDMGGFDDLETSLEANDDSSNDDSDLPEDSVQRALDSMDDFDLGDFEDQLNKIEGN